MNPASGPRWRLDDGPASGLPPPPPRCARVPAWEGSMEGYRGPPCGGRLKKLGPGRAPYGTAPPICIATCRPRFITL